MSEHASRLVQAAIGVVAGGLIGWTATSLTLSGRVEAIEKGQARMESMLVQLLHAKGMQADTKGPAK